MKSFLSFLVLSILQIQIFGQDNSREGAGQDTSTIGDVVELSAKDVLRESEQNLNLSERFSRFLFFNPSVALSVSIDQVKKRDWFTKLSRSAQSEFIKLTKETSDGHWKILNELTRNEADNPKQSNANDDVVIQKAVELYEQSEEKYASKIVDIFDPEELDSLAADFLQTANDFGLWHPIVAKSLNIEEPKRKQLRKRTNDLSQTIAKIPVPEKFSQSGKIPDDVLAPMRLATAKLWSELSLDQLKHYLELRGELQPGQTFSNVLQKQSKGWATILKKEVAAFAKE